MSAPQYQSFPGAAGDSRTLEKLKALRLPVMDGRSFLDVGCNEGFFCGFAHFAGASRSVGLDQSREFVARARARFPDCEFHCSNWDHLPEGTFDVILLASALHYADDQPELLHRLMGKLSRDGVLVLELGIVSSQKPEWIKVTRGIDERWFPSMMQLREVLAPYASKWIGPSVTQEGDPVARHVVHVSHRRPQAYLLMQPPGHGKSSIAGRLFEPAGVKLISGDLQVSRLARGEVEAPEALRAAMATDFSPYLMDRSVDRAFQAGLGRAWVATWLAEADGEDFAFDGYVPNAFHGLVRECVEEAGYLAVQFDWERPGPKLLGGSTLERKANAFYRSLRRRKLPDVAEDVAAASGRAATTRGYVDAVKVQDGKLIISGWAVTGEGELPKTLVVRLNGSIVACDDFEAVDRPDVRSHLDAAHDRLGFRIVMDAGGLRSPADLDEAFSVAPLDGPAFRVTLAAARLLKHD